MEELIKRYQHNAEFQYLVDTLEHFMARNKMTPQDVRDAAFVAGLRLHQKMTKPIYFEEMKDRALVKRESNDGRD